MRQITNQQRIKPWMGFVLFAVVMAVFIFICAPIQSSLGSLGLVITELIFLALAAGYALIFKIPVKEMFPIRKFGARDFFGSLFLVTGGTIFGMISIAIVGIIYPKALESGDVEAIQTITGGSMGYILTMLIIALSPAICEEAIHRGAILSNFRSIRKDWVIVLIMGLFFGINHLSVLRFINTAILGACLTYIVVKKDNIILSSIMHFTVNFSSSTINYISNMAMRNAGIGSGDGPAFTLTADTMKTALGSYLFTGVAAPFLIVLGLMLLNPAAHKKIRFLFAGIAAFIMIISSVVINYRNLNTNKITSSNMSYTVVTENTDAPHVDLNIEKEGTYTFAVVIMNAEGEYYVRIERTDGTVVSNETVPSGPVRTYASRKILDPGRYEIYIVNGKGTKDEKPSISIQVNKV